MTTILQIIPFLPPPPEGVGTHALLLAGALRSRFGIESSFVAASTLPEKTPDALRAALAGAAPPGTTAILHYVGYGYHPRGCPDWLVEGLEGWEGRLVTSFHEVWATGPPWTSSFWLSPRQRRLAGRLARRSDGLLTSMALYRARLLRHTPGREVVVMPVVSTVGEPEQITPLAGRAPRLVLFGGPGTRARAYRHLAADLERACEELGLTEVHDVGPPADGVPETVGGRPVRRLGTLPDAEVSRLLLESMAGYVAYPAPFLAKSSIFAAYCAHGMLPVSSWHRPRRKVEPPPPFWRPSTAVPSSPQELADRASAWYARHNLNRYAETCGSLLLS